jgi:hypothetical protein
VKITFFWDVTPCGLVVTNFMEQSAAFIFSLEYAEDGTIWFLRNVGNCKTTRHRIPEYSKTHFLVPCNGLLLFTFLKPRRQIISVKRTVVCDATLCSPVEVYRHFGGTYCLHLQGRSIACTLLLAWFTLRL